jgi:hypothetical protein
VATEVSICSNALLMLGDDSIADFNEGTRRATLAANLWPDVRDDILRARPWTCARKIDLLAPDPTAPAFGYSKRFLKPSDWLRTLQIGEDYQDVPWRDYDGYIHCDTNPLPIIYTYRNTNPAKYDSMLVRVLTLAMAAQLAYPITKSTTVETNRFNQFGDALRRAAAISGQDDGPEEAGAFDLLTARFRGRSTQWTGT